MNIVKKTVFLFLCSISLPSLQAAPHQKTLDRDGFLSCLGSGISHAIIENPCAILIGGYLALTDFDLIKRNTFWTAFFAASIVTSIVRHTFSVKLAENPIIKTVLENPFFASVAAHTLLFKKENIRQYPIFTLIVGGTLVYNLAQNNIDTNIDLDCSSDTEDESAEEDQID